MGDTQVLEQVLLLLYAPQFSVLSTMVIPTATSTTVTATSAIVTDVSATLSLTEGATKSAVTTALPPQEDQCVVSESMLRSRSHRRTNSPPDMLLFLKMPEPPVRVTPPQSPKFGQEEEKESEVSRKRPASEESAEERTPEETSRISHPPSKKARLVLLSAPPAAIAVRRSVHFSLPEGDGNNAFPSVKTYVRYFDRVDAADVANIWWSGREMLEIQSREKSAIGVMSFCCDNYSEQVLNVLKLARDKTCLVGRAAIASEAPLWVANSPARGLERDIVQGFKQRKRHVVRKVLQSQHDLQTVRHDVTGELATADQKTRLLSHQYQKWSHPMVRFAQVMAEGDAQAVILNNDGVVLG